MGLYRLTISRDDILHEVFADSASQAANYPNLPDGRVTRVERVMQCEHDKAFAVVGRCECCRKYLLEHLSEYSMDDEGVLLCEDCFERGE